MGSIANKYRVHEVAKDFGVSTKEITEILTKYAETPKNHMQVLEDRELSLIFEYLTQHNQVSSIAVIYAEGAKAAEKKPAAEAAKPAQSAACPEQRQAPASRTACRRERSSRPASSQPKQPMSRVPQQSGGGYPQGHQCEPGQVRREAAGHGRRPQQRQARPAGAPGQGEVPQSSSAGTTISTATSASRRRPTVSASCGLRSSRRRPSPCRSPMRSPWASWPAG